MKASDYIVEYIINQNIADVFGYPGGMITHLMDSFAKYKDKIHAHVTYHEQAAAFAACGYAQVSGKPGIAYATSGPGATNLITGICNAYFDSIPTIFITGQVNTSESKQSKQSYRVRQRGFQETDIVSIVKPVTKYADYIKSVDELPEKLEKAYNIATSDRNGPVLLDIPMDVFRADISNPQRKLGNAVCAVCVRSAESSEWSSDNYSEIITKVCLLLEQSNCPCVLIGNGVKLAGQEIAIREFVDKLGIPAVTSMIAFDALSSASSDKSLKSHGSNNYGFIGAYGTRTANFIVAKSDLVISIGSRLDIRQVGVNREAFAPNARIIRFDIDDDELAYPVHSDRETQIRLGMSDIVKVLKCVQIQVEKNYSSWLSVCDEIKGLLTGIDDNHISSLMKNISSAVPEDAIITTDVGQNQVWIAQSFKIKRGQKVLFSGGHGAMGYSLPAAIGAYYGSKGEKTILCVVGDGGMQMNIQELQFIVREQLPIKIIVLNNNSLGMIRHFQEMYFNKRYSQTKPEGGYTAPKFQKIAAAYGIKSFRVDSKNAEDISYLFEDQAPALLEIVLDEDTYVIPKLEFGKPNQDQEPLIDRELYEKIIKIATPPKNTQVTK